MISPRTSRPGASAATDKSPTWLGGGVVVAIIATTLFGLLAVAGQLSPLLALGCVAMVAVSGAVAARRGRDGAANQAPPVSSLDVGASVEAVIGAVPDPVVVLDHDAIVQLFNRHALTVAPALGRGSPLSLALRIPAVLDAVRAAAASGAAQRAEFSERVPIDRWYEAVVTPLRSRAPGGALLLTLHDLTPLRRVEEMRADFVANASHELRTPLASLSGFIDTLQGSARQDAAARERFLAIMREQASRMARLIDDLLSLSRIELSAHVQPEAPVDLGVLLEQVVDSLQVLAAERAVEVSISAPAPAPVVPGDRDELLRVFENLTENALKYGGSGGRVEITLDRGSRPADGALEAVVAVRDYGPGIAAEHLPRLTERFYRVDVGHSRAEGGTGLGLSLVKHVLNRHRGRLTVESVVGQGATFRVGLPLLDADPEAPSSSTGRA